MESENNDRNTLLSIPEAARYMSIPVSTAYNLVQCGLLPVYLIAGFIRRVTLRDVRRVQEAARIYGKLNDGEGIAG